MASKSKPTKKRQPAGVSHTPSHTPTRRGVASNAQTKRNAPSTKRPPNNSDVPHAVILHLNDMLNELKDVLTDYSQHLRSLDRMRLNGVGVKKLGFVERAYELALENAEFLPHYLTLERFGEDIQYFMDFRSLLATSQSN